MHVPLFVCRCPKCGRQNQKSIQLLAKSTICDNCQATFVANDPSSQSAAVNDPMHIWAKFTSNDSELNLDPGENDQTTGSGNSMFSRSLKPDLDLQRKPK
ncbi:MAG: hypothetical protein AAFN77_14305 [Planctomycetota bacterium]